MANKIDEREITITRELVYDIIKRVANLSNTHDSKFYKRIIRKGAAYDYENDTEFDTVLRHLTDADLEYLLLDI